MKLEFVSIRNFDTFYTFKTLKMNGYSYFNPITLIFFTYESR